MDVLIPERTLIMTRHAFIGSGQYSAKWLGEYDAQWDDFRRSLIASVEMPMFGFSLVKLNIFFLYFNNLKKYYLN